MSRGPETWLSPLVALAVLAAIAVQTVGALRVTGAFGWEAEAVPVAVPPAYQSVNQTLERHDRQVSLASVRDPFAARSASIAVVRRPPATPAHVPPPAPAPQPVLTAIVWDADPRALVHWKDRDWTVREGALFDEFLVLSITREQVSLRRGDATLVLQRRNLGE